MRRPHHHRAALTEALNEAIARFQAELRRLARLGLRTRKQTAAASKPRKQAIVPSPARRRVAVAEEPRTRPAAATRPRKPPTSPVATRSRKPPRASEPPAAPERQHPKPAAARAESTEPAKSTQHPEPTQRPELAAQVDEMAPAEKVHPFPTTYVTPTPVVPHTGPQEVPWRGRARSRHEDRAEQQQRRQEGARIRRAAAETRIGSFAPSSEREEPTTARAPDGTQPTGRLQRGTVKWFNAAKGYGFIRADDGTDVFVHRSSIEIEGLRSLSEGQTVSYEERQSPKGLIAVNVAPIQGPT